MSNKRSHTDKNLISWWRMPHRSRHSGSGEQDQRTEEMLMELQEEQSRLSAELEKAFLAYDRKTREIAKRLAKWTGSDASPEEFERLRAEQEDLWRVVRRTQAATRTNHQLEAELKEWTDRTEAAIPPTHPDHPEARTEIVASELRLRGRDPSAFISERSTEAFEGSARDVDPFAEALEESERESPEPIPPDEPINPAPDVITWNPETEETLVREIEDCCREIRRTNNREDRDDLAGEIVMMLNDLRRLHAQLRDHDRKTGIRRYRLTIGDLTIR
jgi:hypothetical protein